VAAATRRPSAIGSIVSFSIPSSIPRQIPVPSDDPGWDGGHLHYFTKHALDGFLRKEGFDVLARKTTGGRSRQREWWISLLGGELIYRCRRV
jgi:hypothetical protein